MTTPPLDYCEIPLTQNQVALIDAVDFEWLNRWKWCAHWNPGTRSFYAVRNAAIEDGKRGHIHMHREIVGMAAGDKRHCDHINHETLDNRRSNLRKATCSQNIANGRQAPGIAGLRGVRLERRSTVNPYVAIIKHQGRQLHLGSYPSASLAHAAYCAAAARLRGEFFSDSKFLVPSRSEGGDQDRVTLA